jgi:hypothetical protein
MLRVIESKSEKRKFQRELKGIIEGALTPQGQRGIGFPGGNMSLPLFSKGEEQLWFATEWLRIEAKIPRFWNGFGLFDPDRTLQNIVVELNIASDSNNEQVAGFFAKDSVTGQVYLMHSGKVGGGRKGIGKSAFLTWSK